MKRDLDLELIEAREFSMKDAYSFDIDPEGMKKVLSRNV